MTHNSNSTTPPGVDIIIPVYRNLAVTQRCVESVLAHTDLATARLILVDDATPEPELAAWCDSIVQHPELLLLRHEHNQGFVAAVNLGMRQSGAHDVVLLNSDTEVPAGWLQRLQRCAYSAPDIATVTPFSNNGSICSYPYFCHGAPLPQGLDLAALDALFAAANSGLSADLPTAVGFCMYIRRDCLIRHGLFDLERYGRGYGEENDFSLRVAAAGRRNCLCADLFVYHHGAVSFGDNSELKNEADKRLVARYPEYPRRVSAFVANDPLRGFRDAVDSLRLEHAGQAPVLLREARTTRDALLEKQITGAGILSDYEALLEDARAEHRASVEEYERVLAKERAAFQATEGNYKQLLDDTRAAYRQTDEALRESRVAHSQAETELNAARYELERLNKLHVIRLGRWLKRQLRR